MVWGVAVCVRVGEFFASPGRWREVVLSRQSRLRMSPGNENVVTCHGAFYKRRAKNAANLASARNPIDFVSVAGLVTVHKI